MKGPAPLLLRAFGRSGTTLTMQILGTSSNVLFHRAYPFEQRLLSYFVRLARLPWSERANAEDWHEDFVLNEALTRLGPLPFEQAQALWTDTPVDAFTREIIATFLRTLDRSAAHPSLPCYYAEKVAIDLADVVNSLVPEARTLWLVRDPRDEFVSVKSFNAKRGYQAFGWCPDDDDLSYASRLVNERRQFLRAFASVVPTEQAYPLRYEDLITDSVSQVVRLGEWLGLEFSWALVEQQRHDFAHHMTSLPSKSSAGRWRGEMSPEVRDLFARELGAELEALGYDL